ncbi:necdin, MAGE family member [Dermacentor variabilis]|uniref:necdin, MAGE family member n=1 Tax=Dermacentor variabilis TaxID=34621 RepID=UPI003F5B99C4
MAESRKRTRLTQSTLNFSQPSRSSAKRGDPEKGGTSISAEDLERLVNDTVYYLLISDQHKEAIKRKDIQKHVLNNSGKVMRTVLASAKEKLQDVFGFELVELDDKQGSVILVRKVDLSEFSQFLKRSDKDLARQGLITLVLALILMNDGVIREDSLWKMLKPYSLDPNLLDSAFGDVRKLICLELVKQAYLEQSVVLGSDPPLNQYRWGVRAKKEFSKRSVLEIVCKVMGQGTRPEHWASVYDEVVRSEQDN